MVLSEALTDACLPPHNKYLLCLESRFSENLSSHSLSSFPPNKKHTSVHITDYTHLSYEHDQKISYLCSIMHKIQFVSKESHLTKTEMLDLKPRWAFLGQTDTSLEI